MRVLFSVLSYHPSFITDESINVGILFHDVINDRRIFEITSNWKRIKSFDDEIDINYFKEILEGIKMEISNDSIFNYKKSFNLHDYVRLFVNELKFSEIKVVETESFEDFVEETKKIFLRYDYDKKDRPDDKQQMNYIRKILKSNNIKCSYNSITGLYDENISFDYIIGDYAFKFFIFENKQIRNQIFNAKAWAYNAKELESLYKVVFVYDIEREKEVEFNIIKKIFEESAFRVMKINEAIDLMLKLKNNDDLLVKSC